MEDGGFPVGVPSERRGRALLFGVITQDVAIERLLISSIQVDGLDATERLLKMVMDSREHIDLIMLASISYGGFNLIDPIEVYEQLKIPVIMANPKEPNREAVRAALMNHFADWRERIAIIERAGHPELLKLGQGRRLYFNAVGVPSSKAIDTIKELTVFGNNPEPLRIAHMLAHELSKNYYMARSSSQMVE